MKSRLHMIPVESSGGPFKTKAQMTLAAPRETSHIQKYLMMNATGLNPGAERPLLAKRPPLNLTRRALTGFIFS